MASEYQPAPVALFSNAAQQFLRAYGDVAQPLLAANIPQVGATTGLGTKGGAGLTCMITNGSQFRVRVVPDNNAAAGGSVALVYPNTPPSIFICSEEAFGPVTQATVSKTITITWTAASFPAAGNGKAFNIEVQPSAAT